MAATQDPHQTASLNLAEPDAASLTAWIDEAGRTDAELQSFVGELGPYTGHIHKMLRARAARRLLEIAQDRASSLSAAKPASGPVSGLPIQGEAKPFGIGFGDTIESLDVELAADDNMYVVKAPRPHPLLPKNYVHALPGFGVVRIHGVTEPIGNDRFGVQTQGIADRIAVQVMQKYGRGELRDKLLEGSIWNEPQDWLAAIRSNEREYGYYWHNATTGSTLPSAIKSINLLVYCTDDDSMLISLIYASVADDSVAEMREKEMIDTL